MTITIRIKTGNAAFADGDKDAEVRRILEGVVEAMPIQGTISLYDYNGNRVGDVTVRGK